MPECYLCGRYIAPGEGHRRTVQTGTSTRVYMTKHGGASYGFRSGLRTLCYKCASIKDRYEEGAALRAAAYFIGWLISAYAGWQIIMHGHGLMIVLIGLSFIFGLPVGIVKVILDNQRGQAIYDEVEGVQRVSVPPWSSSEADTSEPDVEAYKSKRQRRILTEDLVNHSEGVRPHRRKIAFIRGSPSGAPGWPR